MTDFALPEGLFKEESPVAPAPAVPAVDTPDSPGVSLITSDLPIDTEVRSITPANMNTGQLPMPTMTFNDNGQKVVIPKVDRIGTAVDEPGAIEQYLTTGNHLGIFPDTASADTYRSFIARGEGNLYSARYSDSLDKYIEQVGAVPIALMKGMSSPAFVPDIVQRIGISAAETFGLPKNKLIGLSQTAQDYWSVREEVQKGILFQAAEAAGAMFGAFAVAGAVTGGATTTSFLTALGIISGSRRAVEARDEGYNWRRSLASGVATGTIQAAQAAVLTRIALNPVWSLTKRAVVGFGLDGIMAVAQTVAEMKMVDGWIQGKTYDNQQYYDAILNALGVSALLSPAMTVGLHPFVKKIPVQKSKMTKEEFGSLIDYMQAKKVGETVIPSRKSDFESAALPEGQYGAVGDEFINGITVKQFVKKVKNGESVKEDIQSGIESGDILPDQQRDLSMNALLKEQGGLKGQLLDGLITSEEHATALDKIKNAEEEIKQGISAGEKTLRAAKPEERQQIKEQVESNEVTAPLPEEAQIKQDNADALAIEDTINLVADVPELLSAPTEAANKIVADRAFKLEQSEGLEAKGLQPKDIKKFGGRGDLSTEIINAQIPDILKAIRRELRKKGAVVNKVADRFEVMVQSALNKSTGKLGDVMRKNITEVVDKANAVFAKAREHVPTKRPRQRPIPINPFSLFDGYQGFINRSLGIEKEQQYIKTKSPLADEYRKFAQGAKEGTAEQKRISNAKFKEDLRKQRGLDKESTVRPPVIKQLKKRLRENHQSRVDSGTKRTIDTLLGGIDFVKMSDKKFAKLSAMVKDGATAEFGKTALKAVKRLQSQNIKEIPTPELRALNRAVEAIKKKGLAQAKIDKQKLVVKTKKAVEPLAKQSFPIDLSGEESVNAQLRKKQGVETGDLSSSQQAKMMRVFRENRNAILDGGWDFALSLTPMEWANMLDGFKNWEGPNARMLMESAREELVTREKMDNAETAFRKEWETHFEGVDLGEADLVTMMMHLRWQETATAEVLALAEEYGVPIAQETVQGDTASLRKSVPISDQQLQGVEIVRKHVTKNKDRLIKVFEKILNANGSGRVFRETKNYALYLARQGTVDALPTDMVGDIAGRPKFIQTSRVQTMQDFLNTRKGSSQLPRIDMFDIAVENINAREWYIGMQPYIEKIKPLINSKEYMDAVGPTGVRMWQNHVSLIAGNGWLPAAPRSIRDKGLAKARKNVTTAVLPFKLSTLVLQPFAYGNAVIMAWQREPGSVRYMNREMIKALLGPKSYLKKAMDDVYLIKQRVQRGGGDVSIMEALARKNRKSLGDPTFVKWVATETGLKKMEELGFDLISKFDGVTAAAVDKGMRAYYKDAGRTDGGLRADMLTILSQSSTLVTARPQAMGTSEWMRSVLMFQSFQLTQFSAIFNGLIREGIIKGTPTKKAQAAVGLLAYLALFGLQDSTLDEVNSLVGVEYKQKKKSLLAAPLRFLDEIPILGGFFRAYRQGWQGGGYLPLQRVVNQGVRGLSRLGKDPVGGALDLAEVGITLFGIRGMPVAGTAQIFDIINGIRRNNK